MLNDEKMDQLKKLKSLLDEGILTQEEFNEKKTQILNTIEAPAAPVAPTKAPEEPPAIPAEIPAEPSAAPVEKAPDHPIIEEEKPTESPVVFAEKTGEETAESAKIVSEPKESFSSFSAEPDTQEQRDIPVYSAPPANLTKKSKKKKLFLILGIIVAVLLLLMIIGVSCEDEPETYDDSAVTTEETEATEAEPELVVSSITAEYSGDTEKGTVLDENNDGITVTATYEDGSSEIVYGWTVEESKKLKAGKKSKITINYEGQSCELSVKCTTMSENQFKDSCQSISYDALARNPDKHKFENIKIYGQIIQVVEEDGSDEVIFRVATKDSGYGNYYDDVVLVYYTYDSDESKMLEDDMVTMWGTSGGTYTYESTMGGDITIPMMYAQYAKRD